MTDAKDHWEFRANSRAGEITQVQSDQSEHEDPYDHDGEYNGWDDEEEWQEGQEEEEEEDDEAVNPDTSAAEEAFCPCGAERKVKEMHERNEKEKEKLKKQMDHARKKRDSSLQKKV